MIRPPPPPPVPPDIKETLRQADALYKAGRIGDALKVFLPAFNRLQRSWGANAPELEPFHFNLCQFLEGSGRTDDAYQLASSWVREHPMHVGHRLLAGNLAVAKGRMEDAIGFFEPALKGEGLARLRGLKFKYRTLSDVPDIFARVADLYERVGERQKAREAALGGLAEVPDHTNCRFILAELHFKDQRHDEAQAALEPAHKSSPGDYKIARLYGAILRAQKKPEETLKVYEPFLEKGLEETAFLREYALALHESGRSREGADLLIGALVENPHDDEFYFHLGGILLRLRMEIGETIRGYYQAREVYHREMNRARRTAAAGRLESARYYEGRAEVAVGNYKVALERFQEAHRMSPRIPEINEGLGDLYLRLERPHDAIALLAGAPTDLVKPWIIKRVLAEAYGIAGDFEAAEKAILEGVEAARAAKMVENPPGLPRANLQAAAFFIARRRDAERARAHIEGLIPEDRLGWELPYWKGRLALLEEKHDDAVGDLERAIAEVPEPKAEVFVALGQAHLAAGEASPAKDAFERAGELDPYLAEIWDGLAKAEGPGPDSDAHRARAEAIRKAEGELATVREGMRGKVLDASLGDLLAASRIYAAAGASDRARRLALFVRETRPGATEGERAVMNIFDRPEDVFFRMRSARAVLAKDPVHPDARRALALAHAVLGYRLPEAEATAAALVKEDPSAANLYALARIQAAAGRMDDARATARKALDADPDLDECRRFLEELDKGF